MKASMDPMVEKLKSFGISNAEIWITLLCFVVVCYLIVVVLKAFGILSNNNGKKGDTILILGECNVGKTSLYYKLRDGQFPDTVTSMKASSGSFALSCDSTTQKDAKKFNLMDYPGHQRLRSQVHDFFPIASGIIFLMNATDLKNSILSSASYLFDIFSDPKVNDMAIQMIIACNKVDIEPVDMDKIKRSLEEEITQLRNTRTSLEVEGEEDENETSVPLGREGKSFQFDLDSPCEVIFSTCSVKEGQLDSILDFIHSV